MRLAGGVTHWQRCGRGPGEVGHWYWVEELMEKKGL